MDVTQKLMLILEDRGWSEYRLAKESNLPHSTVLNIFQRNNQPSISTLEAMCNGLGITLAQFFTEDESLVMLTEEQKEILEKYEALSKGAKEMIVDLLNVMFRHLKNAENKSKSGRISPRFYYKKQKSPVIMRKIQLVVSEATSCFSILRTYYSTGSVKIGTADFE